MVCVIAADRAGDGRSFFRGTAGPPPPVQEKRAATLILFLSGRSLTEAGARESGSRRCGGSRRAPCRVFVGKGTRRARRASEPSPPEVPVWRAPPAAAAPGPAPPRRPGGHCHPQCAIPLPKPAHVPVTSRPLHSPRHAAPPHLHLHHLDPPRPRVGPPDLVAHDPGRRSRPRSRERLAPHHPRARLRQSRPRGLLPRPGVSLRPRRRGGPPPSRRAPPPPLLLG